MPRATTWSDLKIGIFALLSALALAAGVLQFARIGALHGATTTIYMVSDGADGVIRGTEVWLAGRRVGRVEDVRLRPVTTDTSERVLIQMEILSQYMGEVRKNSTARIRPGTSLIAEPVVAITSGTTNARAIADGDTVHALSQISQHSAPVDIASLGDSIVAVAATVREVAGAAQTTAKGPISHLRQRTEAQAAEVRRAIDLFSSRSSPRWRGTASLAARDTTLWGRVARVKAQADSIQRLMSSEHTTIGRLRRDSMLDTEARHLLASARQLRTQLSASRSTLVGRDSALARQLDGVERQLDSLVADVKREPLKYNPF